MSTSVKNIIGPSTRVIIWISKENFSKENDLYHEFNYLYDGLFSRRERSLAKTESRSDLFTTMSFGKELCLYRLHPEKINDMKDEIKKKAQEGINSHTVLAVDAKLEDSFYKVTKEFESIPNLEIHLSKDLVK